jgi:hypothetical protein
VLLWLENVGKAFQRCWIEVCMSSNNDGGDSNNGNTNNGSNLPLSNSNTNSNNSSNVPFERQQRDRLIAARAVPQQVVRSTQSSNLETSFQNGNQPLRQGDWARVSM